METIPLRAVALRDAVLTVADDAYTAGVNEVTFVPEPEWEWDQPLHGDPEPAIVGVRWSVVLGYAQDFSTPKALAIYLVENAAQRRTLTFTPRAGGRPVTADVLIIPGHLGGPSGELLAATAEMPVYGRPVVGEVPAAATAAVPATPLGGDTYATPWVV